jgi:hypothetical protein
MMSEKTEREQAIERERDRDEIRSDPNISPMIKRVMERFWLECDIADGRTPSSGAKQ